MARISMGASAKAVSSAKNSSSKSSAKDGYSSWIASRCSQTSSSASKTTTKYRKAESTGNSYVDQTAERLRRMKEADDKNKRIIDEMLKYIDKLGNTEVMNTQQVIQDLTNIRENSKIGNQGVHFVARKDGSKEIHDYDMGVITTIDKNGNATSREMGYGYETVGDVNNYDYKERAKEITYKNGEKATEEYLAKHGLSETSSPNAGKPNKGVHFAARQDGSKEIHDYEMGVITIIDKNGNVLPPRAMGGGYVTVGNLEDYDYIERAKEITYKNGEKATEEYLKKHGLFREEENIKDTPIENENSQETEKVEIPKDGYSSWMENTENKSIEEYFKTKEEIPTKKIDGRWIDKLLGIKENTTLPNKNTTQYKILNDKIGAIIEKAVEDKKSGLKEAIEEYKAYREQQKQVEKVKIEIPKEGYNSWMENTENKSIEEHFKTKEEISTKKIEGRWIDKLLGIEEDATVSNIENTVQYKTLNDKIGAIIKEAEEDKRNGLKKAIEEYKAYREQQKQAESERKKLLENAMQGLSQEHQKQLESINVGEMTDKDFDKLLDAIAFIKDSVAPTEQAKVEIPKDGYSSWMENIKDKSIEEHFKTGEKVKIETPIEGYRSWMADRQKINKLAALGEKELEAKYNRGEITNVQYNLAIDQINKSKLLDETLKQIREQIKTEEVKIDYTESFERIQELAGAVDKSGTRFEVQTNNIIDISREIFSSLAEENGNNLLSRELLDKMSEANLIEYLPEHLMEHMYTRVSEKEVPTGITNYLEGIPYTNKKGQTQIGIRPTLNEATAYMMSRMFGDSVTKYLEEAKQLNKSVMDGAASKFEDRGEKAAAAVVANIGSKIASNYRGQYKGGSWRQDNSDITEQTDCDEYVMYAIAIGAGMSAEEATKGIYMLSSLNVASLLDSGRRRNRFLLF